MNRLLFFELLDTKIKENQPLFTKLLVFIKTHDKWWVRNIIKILSYPLITYLIGKLGLSISPKVLEGIKLIINLLP